MARDETAGLIVIGNEILSGKVVDTNSAFLAQQLRSLGVTLRRMVVIPDEVDVIAAEVRAMRADGRRALHLGRRRPDARRRDHRRHGARPRPRGRPPPVARAHAARVLRRRASTTRISSWPRWSRAPSSSTTATSASRPSGSRTSTSCPGIPEIFREKVLALRPRFTSDPFHLRVVYTREMESAIAGASQSHAGAVSRAVARLVSEAERPRVPGADHARVEGSAVRRARPRGVAHHDATERGGADGMTRTNTEEVSYAADGDRVGVGGARCSERSATRYARAQDERAARGARSGGFAGMGDGGGRDEPRSTCRRRCSMRWAAGWSACWRGA